MLNGKTIEENSNFTFNCGIVFKSIEDITFNLISTSSSILHGISITALIVYKILPRDPSKEVGNPTGRLYSNL